MTAIGLLDDLRRRGVRVWIEGGTLRYKATTSPVPVGLRAALIAHKPELLAILAAEQAEALEERRAIQEADGIFLETPGRPWSMADAVAAALRVFPGARIEKRSAVQRAAA